MAYIRKTKWHSLRIGITEKEYERVAKGYAGSTCRSISEYLRKLMFGRPVTMWYRNHAFDEFIEESIRLRKALGVFSSQGGFDEQERVGLVQKIEEIRLIVIKISETCLQK